MRQSRKASITMLALALFSFVLWAMAPATATAIKVATDSDIIKLPDFNVDPRLVSAISAFVMLAVALFVGWLAVKKNSKSPRWAIVLFGLAFVIQTLVLLFSGKTMTISDLLRGSLVLAVPLIFGSMAGVLSERVGVVNIAIEGQLLAGAFTSALIASITHRRSNRRCCGLLDSRRIQHQIRGRPDHCRCCSKRAGYRFDLVLLLYCHAG